MEGGADHPLHLACLFQEKTAPHAKPIVSDPDFAFSPVARFTSGGARPGHSLLGPADAQRSAPARAGDPVPLGSPRSGANAVAAWVDRSLRKAVRPVFPGPGAAALEGICHMGWRRESGAFLRFYRPALCRDATKRSPRLAGTARPGCLRRRGNRDFRLATADCCSGGRGCRTRARRAWVAAPEPFAACRP